ncbi:putative cysteine-rich repeat secretory protein 36 isoform X2 [Capsella rubella]|uniref:putative cysteine-rich repeat secretory protein 36 isoform X2 n=1 Tax=Capsella rubella TaxID=81985 RepID=UPI000CD58B6A|nr:putative cysteine-rich repeat secretory protein 36 isoform X2 [Capsella rubella]
MHSSYFLSKYFVCFQILAIQIFVRYVSSLNLTNAYLHHKCLVDQGKYKPGSEYEENLNHLINHISSTQKFPDGFTHTSHGEAPNFITIVFQCRGDSYGSRCSSCYATAVAEVICQRYKGGIIWYDQCFLDVSTIDTPPTMIDYENTFSMHNQKTVNEDAESFNKKTRGFLYNLILEANKPKMGSYAAGEMRLGTKKLYAMVQCALDIFQCKVCLEWSINELSKCCQSKQGARVLGTSCSIRYELYPFLRT